MRLSAPSEMLAFAGPLGAPATWLLVAVGVFVLVLALVRDRRVAGVGVIAWVRWLGVGGLLAILVVAPTREAPAPDEAGRPSVVIMVDTSESMAIGDETLGREACTRWEALRRAWLDPDTIARLRDAGDVRFVGVDARTRSRALPDLLGSPPSGEQSRLSRGVRTLLSALSDRGSGNGASTELVMLTDGIDTDGESLGALGDEALGAGVRIHGVVPGSDRGLPDVSVILTASADIVYAGQGTDLSVRIRQSGFDGRVARVVVREGGEAGRIVYDRPVTLERSTRVWVPIAPERDDAAPAERVQLVEYVASVEALEGEIDATNNTRRAFVRVTEEQIRVCVFEASAYWDTKFFVQALRDDPQVELTVVHSLGSEMVGGRREPRMHVVRYVPDAVASYEERVSDAPLSENELNEFDVIVLGKGIELFFPSMEAEKLTRFVTERGGSLIFLRGRPISSDDPGARRAGDVLEEISPVSWGEGVLPGGRLALTPEGRSQRALQFEHLASTEAALEDLPSVIATTAVEREKALSVVWLRQDGAEGPGDDAPAAAIAHMNVGRGRTLAVLSDGMWRWAFLPAALGEHSSVYQAFWSRAVRWLALGGEFLPGQSVSLDVDRLTASPGQGVTAIVRTRFVELEGFEPRLILRTPGGVEREVGLGASAASPSKLTGLIVPEEEGVHELMLTGELAHGDAVELSTRFAVYDDRVELMETGARPEEVRALSEKSGGMMLGLDGVDELIRLLEDERAAAMTTRQRVPAWDSPWVFFAIVALLGVEWIVRRRMGLA